MPKVGKYELGKTVGRGAFSKVKVAVHEETGQERVIKIIDKRGADGKTASQVESDVKHEISIMKVLQHENIVRLYEVMESSKHFYIVLESVRGGDLCDHVMDQGKLPERQAQTYLHHLVEGLIACHAAGVAHRDVKPENCLISTDGILKVADFGLSRLHKGKKGPDDIGPGDMATDAVGTLSYAAPEVLEGRYNAFLADLWSIGVVIFVMITGKFPFGSKGQTEAQIQQDIRKARINKFPSHVSEDAKNLILCLIVVDPESRLGLEQILDHSWLRVEMVESPRAAGAGGGGGSTPALPSIARRRPQGIDVDQVRADAGRIEAEGNVITDAASPKWQDSPAAGTQQRRQQLPMFTPKAGATSAVAGGGGGDSALASLKDSLQKESEQLGADT